MTDTIDEPQQSISKEAVKIWRLTAFLNQIPLLAIAGGMIYASDRFGWVEWIGMILYILLALILLRAIYKIFIYPVYLQKTWRYDITDQQIQLKYGALEKTFVLVPMTKVQYVNTNQGPLLRRYGLLNLAIGTMASTHEIPALPEKEAIEIRTRIASQANIKDSDE